MKLKIGIGFFGAAVVLGSTGAVANDLQVALPLLAGSVICIICFLCLLVWDVCCK